MCTVKDIQEAIPGTLPISAGHGKRRDRPGDCSVCLSAPRRTSSTGHLCRGRPMLRTAGNTESDRRSLFLKIAAFFMPQMPRGVMKWPFFRIERTRDYTVMSNHHLRNRALSLKAKGLLSMMLSLPDDWNYTTRGLAKNLQGGRGRHRRCAAGAGGCRLHRAPSAAGTGRAGSATPSM